MQHHDTLANARPGCRIARTRTAIWRFVGTGCMVLLAACGGVDSGGTGAPTSSLASGPVTGFGSVIVNDIHFEVTSAVVTDADGNLRSQGDLRLGMTTVVRGSAITLDGNGTSVSTATAIVFGSEIVGPVAANSVSGKTLRVLGQTVDVTATTAFDDSLVGGQAALAVGDVVEVYARFDAATLHYAATRIERRATVGGYRLRGIVAGLDTAAKTFSLGSIRVSYGSLSSIPSDLSNGVFVRVALPLAPIGSVLNATAVVDAGQPFENRDEVKIKGLVSAYLSGTQFSVDGTPVDARSAQFSNGSTGLALGTRVEVEGATVNGVLVATRVTSISDDDDAGESFEVRDVIASIDIVARTFVAHRVVVSYGGTIDFRNGTVTDLAVGRNVEARGTLSADGTKLQASRIDFRN